ncbi:uncharacterized protein LOC109849526 [Asparagus officinalis]|uniref:uncharacterized protein LOC109849526 n=1 Tax=Asparagus officinalis TaxID=4686 RepID=UPI00098E75DD|nr:uncharacterized protein LOC109849526 [Asparagus officinalis]
MASLQQLYMEIVLSLCMGLIGSVESYQEPFHCCWIKDSKVMNVVSSTDSLLIQQYGPFGSRLDNKEDRALQTKPYMKASSHATHAIGVSSVHC